MHPVLRLGDDAGLPLAAERHRPLQESVRSAGCRSPAGQRACAGRTDYRGGDPGRTEQLASGKP
ncbi:uncharacterized protein RMCFA_0646 [Mycolicibacterium fortuitum subsp. acetamidolyticum]|uniref:Uncharacterized protein n=1 Tax=Mycolicibacterium fortuitum subsp. acetamidolyticum TaxID=144550 RepID=A0A100WLY8_MYCFO|nr:uncharacterized protein RMCFA_0646 [Mycolicibacterium fortuitum subsp. acetamidolyticum]